MKLIVPTRPTVRIDAEDSRRILYGDDETDDGNAFVIQATAAAVAASYSQVQVFNPAASGVVFYLDKVTFAPTGGADYYILRRQTAALANVDSSGQSKDLGGAACVTVSRNESSGAGVGTAYGQGYARSSTDGSTVMEFNPPIKLGAGEGFSIQRGTANAALYAQFEGREYTA
jgi:hypothetical protein